ncbi:MAG: ABC transporter permease subunit [Thaumarchaeota archaeon]|nr:ABC transporter permease subunit [Nitrososphaerota archaeon]
MKSSRSWISGLILVTTLTVGLLLIEILVDRGVVRSSYIPAPSSVAISFSGAFSSSIIPLRDTLLEVLLVFLISYLSGIGFGLLIGSIAFMHDTLNVYLNVLYATPKILFLPIFIIVFGLRYNTVLLFAILEASIPTLLLTVGNVRDIDKTLFVVARSMGASRMSMETKVLVPAIMASILDVARICLVFTFIGVLIAQIYIGLGGIGQLLSQYAYSLRIPQLYGIATFVAIIVLVVFSIMQYGINKFSKKWQDFSH